MNVLVTGGAGFVGSHLVQTLLQQGHVVVVVDDLSSGKRENVPAAATFVLGDVRQMEKLDLPKKIDVVYHLAAQIDVRHSVQDPLFDESVNVHGTISALQYAVRAGAQRFVYSSSGGALYGAAAVPTPEETPCQSSSPYGIAKWAAEQYVRLYGRLHNLPFTILRYSNIYGPGQDGSKESGVVAIFTKRALEGQGLTIFGDGEQTRDFVYVKDVVAANVKAMTQQGSGIYNIATGRETTIKDLAQSLNKVLPKPVAIHFGPSRKGEEMRSCLDSRLAQKELGWQPSVTLEQGLRETVQTLQDKTN